METAIVELTLEERDLVVSALGIAEQAIGGQRLKFISEIVGVRGGRGSVITSNPDSLEAILYNTYLTLENKYCDLRYKFYEDSNK